MQVERASRRIIVAVSNWWLPNVVARVQASVAAKLLVAYLVIVGLMIGLGALGLSSLQAAHERTERLNRLQSRQVGYYVFLSQLRTIEVLAAAAFTGHSQTMIGRLGARAPMERMRDLQGSLAALKRALRSEPDPLPVEIERLDELGRIFSDLLEATSDFEARFLDGNEDEALTVLRESIAPRIEDQARQLHTISTEVSQEMKTLTQTSVRDFEASRRFMIYGSALSVLLAILLGYGISSSIVRPLRSTGRALKGVASGEFDTRIDVQNRDELGELAENVNRMTAQLGTLYGELEAANLHKSQFLANMSHELRTPMNSILGYTELIRDGIYGEPPEKIAEVLERIDANGQNLLALINDVLDISKIEAGELKLALDDYRMDDIVQSVASVAEPLVAEKGLRFEVDLPGDLPRGFGDAARLRQVVLNLVGNAIKFTDEGLVRVRARASGGMFHLTVEDTGPGISVADQEHIFDEFQQIDNSSTREKGGSGLGLAISSRIVALHGGRIAVESAPGEGARFTVEVPVRASLETEEVPA